MPTDSLDRKATFTLPDGLEIFGGFSGDEMQRSDRDPVRFPTILSGDIGVSKQIDDNVYHVVTLIDATDGVSVDGLWITDAQNDRPEELGRGGGIYAVRSVLRIRQCTVTRNMALGGGGLWNEESMIDISYSTLSDNENRAVHNNNSKLTIRETIIESNRNTGHEGGAIFDSHGSATTAVDCVFVSNHSQSEGGAVFSLGTSVYVNCVFRGNRCGDYGGAFFQWAGSLTLTNCTFADNWVRNFFGGGVSSIPKPTIVNCVFWGNRSPRGDVQRQQRSTTSAVINHSCVQGWTGSYGGVGNHGLDPRFIDFDKGDFRMEAGSPCIDAGDNAAVTSPHDLDGNPRILNDVVDMGAYESICSDVEPVRLKCPGQSKLKATLPTRLPDGGTVIFSSDADRPKSAPVRRGKAKAKWDRPPDGSEICASGCPETCRRSKCE
ncbi:MAG: right-handed parallel beta-helix repeat-containing protein [Phycisphaerales bacterium]|nr:MAG: right-handed parallel beta-helix repeat-containing protein [Phycisphaerales bacterium]